MVGNLVYNSGPTFNNMSGWSGSTGNWATGWVIGNSPHIGDYSFQTLCSSSCSPISQVISPLIPDAQYKASIWARGVITDPVLLIIGGYTAIYLDVLTTSVKQYTGTFIANSSSETLLLQGGATSGFATRIDTIEVILSDPSEQPTFRPTDVPSIKPSVQLTEKPTTAQPSSMPSMQPSKQPTEQPISIPSMHPSKQPSGVPTVQPSIPPSSYPSLTPSSKPTGRPTTEPTHTTSPTIMPTFISTGTFPNTQPISVVGTNNTFKIVLPFLQASWVSGNGFFDVIIDSPISGTNYVVLGNNTLDDIDVTGANYNGRQAYSINNAISYDSSGRSVSPAGDVNGDRDEDLIIGVPYESLCYVLFGKSSGFNNLDQGFTITGDSPYDGTGWSVSNAGNMNGDEYDEVLISAPYANSGAGVVYVIFGKGYGFINIDLKNWNPDYGFRIYGALANKYIGSSVSSAGDFNGDGNGDILISSLNMSNNYQIEVHVIFGKETGFSDIYLNNMSINQGFTITGSAISSSGCVVSPAGDVNNDGYDDILIGCTNIKDNIPISYLVFGKATEFSNINLDKMTALEGITIKGAGTIVANIGYINNDNYADIMVGSNDNDDNNNQGYVVVSPDTFIFPPSLYPTEKPTDLPSIAPSVKPSITPSAQPIEPSYAPSVAPTDPTFEPTSIPSSPTPSPTIVPTAPTIVPTTIPTIEPTISPTIMPTQEPSIIPTINPTALPTFIPSAVPTIIPTLNPTVAPTNLSISVPTEPPTVLPSEIPILQPTTSPTKQNKQSSVELSTVEIVALVISVVLGAWNIRLIADIFYTAYLYYNYYLNLNSISPNLESDAKDNVEEEAKGDLEDNLGNQNSAVALDYKPEQESEVIYQDDSSLSPEDSSVSGGEAEEDSDDLPSLELGCGSSDSDDLSSLELGCSSSSSSSSFSYNDRIIYSVHHIKYDGGFTLEQIPEIYKIGGIKAVNEFLSLKKYEKNILPLIKQIPTEKVTLVENKFLENEDTAIVTMKPMVDQLPLTQDIFQNHLLNYFLGARQFIEYIPTIKHLTKATLNISLPEFLDNKSMLFTTHLAIGHIGAALLPKELSNNGLIISTASSASFGISLTSSYYLDEQRQETLDNVQVKKYCALTLLSYTFPGLITCAASKFILPEYQCSVIDLSVKVALAGVECYNAYQDYQPMDLDATNQMVGLQSEQYYNSAIGEI